MASLRRVATGQSLMELAFILPLLLLLAVGAIEFGRYAYSAIEVGNAAHAGAAYGAQSQSDAANLAGITAAACNDFEGVSYSGTGTCNPPLAVSSDYVCQCDTDGVIGSSIGCTTGTCTAPAREVVSLQVTASGTFTSLFKYPGIPQTIAIAKTATMRIQ